MDIFNIRQVRSRIYNQKIKSSLRRNKKKDFFNFLKSQFNVFIVSRRSSRSDFNFNLYSFNFKHNNNNQIKRTNTKQHSYNNQKKKELRKLCCNKL